MRDMKSLITYIYRKKFGFQGSNMKYTQFNGEDLSEKNLNIPVGDMLEEEKLNCDLQILSSALSGSCGSNSLNGLNLEVCDNGAKSSHDTTDFCDNSSERLKINEMQKDEIPLKLVVTYHFSFDTEDSYENTNKHWNCVTSTHAERQSDELSDVNDYDSDKDDVFEDVSFSCDDDAEILEYSSVINGSKNNLLDESYGEDQDHSMKNVRLVDYDSDPVSNNSKSDLDLDLETNSSSKVDNEDGKTYVSDSTDSNDNTENVIKYHGNPCTPSMRKNFIYYSSAVKLYSGELRYEDCYPEKKFKLARRMFKKVFPSRKYVVNNNQ